MARETLTSKQEAFYIVYLETHDCSEAYRRSYNTDKMSADAIRVEGNKLLKHPTIAKRLAVFQDRVDLQAHAKGMLTLDEHMEELKALRDAAKQANQLSAAITAEVKRGELRKFYVKQIETGEVGAFKQAGEDDLEKYIATEGAALGLFQPPAKSARH